jgi:hypothetical protein
MNSSAETKRERWRRLRDAIMTMYSQGHISHVERDQRMADIGHLLYPHQQLTSAPRQPSPQQPPAFKRIFPFYASVPSAVAGTPSPSPRRVSFG